MRLEFYNQFGTFQHRYFKSNIAAVAELQYVLYWKAQYILKRIQLLEEMVLSQMN